MPDPAASPPTIENGPGESSAVLVLAHGAGAPMDSPFMDAFATGIGAAGIRVVRFEFPYMAARRQSRRPGPDREAVLLDTWREVVKGLAGAQQIVIGGKSMGGRMASMVVDELAVAGLVCLGYPFHAPGRPDRPRIAHLRELATPALIVQGTRDPFAGRDEVAGYGLSPSIRLRWLPDGDHDFRPRATSGRSQAENWAEGVAAVVEFVRAIAA